jgi:hypothetical protein
VGTIGIVQFGQRILVGAGLDVQALVTFLGWWRALSFLFKEK